MSCQCRFCTHPEIPRCPCCGNEDPQEVLLTKGEGMAGYGVDVCAKCANHYGWEPSTVTLASLGAYTFSPETGEVFSPA